MSNSSLLVMVMTKVKKYLLRKLGNTRQLKTEYHLKGECLRAYVIGNEVFNER